MAYATEEEFTAQFRELSPAEEARLPALLRVASRLIDRKITIDPNDKERLEDAKVVVLSMVSSAFPPSPGVEGLRSWTKTVGDRSESATASDELLGIRAPSFLPWHLELLGIAASGMPRFRFPPPRIIWR